LLLESNKEDFFLIRDLLISEIKELKHQLALKNFELEGYYDERIADTSSKADLLQEKVDRLQNVVNRFKVDLRVEGELLTSICKEHIRLSDQNDENCSQIVDYASIIIKCSHCDTLCQQKDLERVKSGEQKAPQLSKIHRLWHEQSN
jgi:hypothetical protein